MNNEEINRLVAQKIMNFEEIPTKWNPTVLMQDAWSVVRKMKTKGVFFNICTSDFSVLAWIYDENGSPKPLAYINDTLAFDEIPQAICLTALLALEKKESQQVNRENPHRT